MAKQFRPGSRRQPLVRSTAAAAAGAKNRRVRLLPPHHTHLLTTPALQVVLSLLLNILLLGGSMMWWSGGFGGSSPAAVLLGAIGGGSRVAALAASAPGFAACERPQLDNKVLEEWGCKVFHKACLDQVGYSTAPWRRLCCSKGPVLPRTAGSHAPAAAHWRCHRRRHTAA